MKLRREERTERDEIQKVLQKGLLERAAKGKAKEEERSKKGHGRRRATSEEV